MDQATPWWMWWLSWLSSFATVFTRPGWVRFVQWVTGMVLCWEAHTLTHILTALGLQSRWRVPEHFAEYGAWDREAVARQTLRLIEQERPARWGCYHPVAIDDTTWRWTSAKVWGTCILHEASARSPNRAETVRAHHRVVMGDLVPGTPWTCLPHAARLYCRQKQLPPARLCTPKRPGPRSCCARPRQTRGHRSWECLVVPTRWGPWSAMSGARIRAAAD
jgi:hypothetical protein